MFETPVIMLSGGKDCPQRITHGIERNDIRGRGGGHGSVCVRGVGVGKGLTAS